MSPPSIASLRSIYKRRQTLSKHQLWAKTYLGLRELEIDDEAALTAADAERALAKRYGWQWSLLRASEKLRGLVGIKAEPTYIEVTLGEVARTEGQ